MSAESTKEATAEGHKVTTVVEGAEATAAAPEEVASPPESVAIFFDGEPMAGKAETWMTEHVADAATLQFVGPHALPLPLFDKAGFPTVPWPVDYRTSGKEGVGLFTDNAIDALETTTVAAKEWIGLFAYWLTGKIDQPFPGPA